MVDREYVEEELSMARMALSDAEQLVAGSGSDEGVVNRLYYAVFHAAQAALYDRDVNPSSHSALVTDSGPSWYVTDRSVVNMVGS